METQQSKPHWYVTEYPLMYKVQLLTEADKEECREDCIYHGPFRSSEEAVSYCAYKEEALESSKAYAEERRASLSLSNIMTDFETATEYTVLGGK